MPHTSDASKSKIIRNLEKLTAYLAENGPQPLAEATQSMLSALSYNDTTLVESAFVAARDAFRGQVTQTVSAQLKMASELRTGVRDLLSTIENNSSLEPGERLDEAGKLIQSIHHFSLEFLQRIIDHSGEIMKSLGIDLIETVNDEIKYWSDLKSNVLDTWPWSNRGPLPVDREMVAASRAAFARGEVVPLDELIRSNSGS